MPQADKTSTTRRRAARTSSLRTPAATPPGPPIIGTVPIPEGVTDPNAYGLIVRGGCMAPDVQDGALVIASPAAPWTAGALVVIQFKSGDPVCRRLVRPPLLPIRLAPGSEVSEVVQFEQSNPPAHLGCPADRIEAMHVIVAVLPARSFVLEALS